MGKSNSVICVLGCHRSGTSLVAGILDKLGVSMGNITLQPNLGNPLGYFEDVDFYEMNERILESAGGSWHNPPDENEIIFMRDNFPKLKEEIKQLIDKKKKKLWGWKDPRTALTMEIYLPLLENPKFIVVDRDDEEIIESFRKRDGHNKYGNQELIDIYREQINKFFEQHQLPKLELEYKDIIADREKSVKEIAKFVGVKTNKEAVEMVKSREEIIELRDEYRISEADKYENRGAYHWEDYKQDPFYRQHVDYILKLFRDKEGLLLDVGCGDGLISALLSQYLKVTGIDISEKAIGYAKDKNKLAQFEVRNVFDMSGGFDYLLASEIIEHLSDPEAFLKKIKELFNKEAVITTPNKEVHKVPDPHHFREFNKEEFETMLKKYFNEVQVDKRGMNLYGIVR